MNDLDRLTTALADRYQIEREIGAGGMATVYLAHDVRHDRNVAVKVLQPELAAVLGAERFLNEITVTANLQHPHILPLHDSGAAGPPGGPDTFLYYVMPYVEGESLRDRLERETQLSIDDALQIAQEVADGLSYAHSLGVVHRDIKPENILLSGGHALIADFGIARAVTEAGGTRLTETGLSLGTPQYMSPEQASGERDVDARSDVYALGCVTYEMLVGEPPHTGPNAQAIVARVLTQPVTSVRESRDLVSPQADSAIRKALAKLPADRFATTQQFADALRTSGPTMWDTTGGAAAIGAEASRPPWVSFLPWGLVAALTAVVAGLLVWSSGSTARSAEGATRLVFDLGEADSVAAGMFPTETGAEVRTLAISTDGRRIAFIGRSGDETTTHLYIRELDEFEARRLPETESASSPFFSPDGQWVGFYSWSEGRLKTVPITGGTPQVVCVCPPIHSATWGPDGTIIMDHAGLGGLRAVEATGGEPEEFTFHDRHNEDDEYSLVHPQLLPDGGHLLTTAWGSNAGSRRIALFSLEAGERTTLLENGWAPQYVQSGHIVFQRLNQLWAVRFDLDRLEVVGTPVPVVDSVYSAPFVMAYAVSESGTLVYAPGPFPDLQMSFHFLPRSGRMESIPSEGRWTLMGPRLSPAGDRIVSAGTELAGWRESQSSARIWLYDFAGRNVRPLTDPGPGDYWPIWAPDGRSVVYGSVRSGERQELYRVAVDEPGAQPELVYSDSAAFMQPYSWLPGGDGLAFNRVLAPGADLDIWLVRFGADTTAEPLVASSASEFHPAISPNGRWLAFTSDQSGQPEVYMMRYPELDDIRQVSSGGGMAPAWRENSRELYYGRVEGTGGTFMRVPVGDDGPGDPEVAWSPSVQTSVGNPYGRGYDVTPDGQRLLLSVNEQEWQEFLPDLRIVFNWFDELTGAFEQ